MSSHLPPRRRRRAERGMVTAEVAVLAPLAVAFVVLLTWLVSLGYTQIQLTDAAREAARMVARGDTASDAERVAREQSPSGAHVTITTDDGVVTVTVTATSSMPGDWFAGPLARDLSATAVAAAESP